MLRRLNVWSNLNQVRPALPSVLRIMLPICSYFDNWAPDLYFWQQLLTFGSRNWIESTVTHLKNEVVNKTLGSKLLWITLRPIDVSKI